MNEIDAMEEIDAMDEIDAMKETDAMVCPLLPSLAIYTINILSTLTLTLNC